MFKEVLIEHLQKSFQMSYSLISQTGNLCFVNNNEELKDDFKTTFSEKDILAYVNYSNKIPYSAEEFWKKVNASNQLFFKNKVNGKHQKHKTNNVVGS